MARCPQCNKEIAPTFRKFINARWSWAWGKYGFISCEHCGATPLCVRYRDVFFGTLVTFLPPIALTALAVSASISMGENKPLYGYAILILSSSILSFAWIFYWKWLWWKKIVRLRLVKGSHDSVITDLHIAYIAGLVAGLVAGLAVFFGGMLFLVLPLMYLLKN